MNPFFRAGVFPQGRLEVAWQDDAWNPAVVVCPQESPAPEPSGTRRSICLRRVSSVFVRHSHGFNLRPMKTSLARTNRLRWGFTLIELLVVIAIIGILAALLLPVIATMKTKAMVTQTKNEISGMMTALAGYDSQYHRFPTSSNAVEAAASDSNANNKDFTFGGTFKTPSGTFKVGDEGTRSKNYFVTNEEVIAVLMDLERYRNGNDTINKNHVKNPQRAASLHGKDSSTPTGPGIGEDGAYRDPWGNPYVISMDLNYNEHCKDGFYRKSSVSQATTGKPQGLNGLFNPIRNDGNSDDYEFNGPIMIWSAGPDKMIDPNPSNLDGGKANAGANKDNVLSWK
jgi:prepilin-type N-terminal cleavage/methylation domain-containing protein